MDDQGEESNILLPFKYVFEDMVEDAMHKIKGLDLKFGEFDKISEKSDESCSCKQEQRLT